MTEQAGERVLERAVGVAQETLGDELTAAYALGSLAHGGFAPLTSDVDLMLVVEPARADTGGAVEAITRRIQEEDASELAARLSVFWSDRRGVHLGLEAGGGPGRLPEVDRLDLLHHGRLLHGSDVRAGAREPGLDAIVRQTAEFALTKFDDTYRERLRHPRHLVEEGPRTATKAALFPIRFLYTVHTGRIGQNDAAAAWFEDHPHGALATHAMAWRVRGIDDPDEATAVMTDHLVPVHHEFARAYAERVGHDGNDALADRLRAWGRSL